MSNPKISCITTTYNRTSLLKKTINSVLNQSEKDFEYFIVDDCSTDDTEKVIKSFKDKRIKYLKTEKNCGFDSQPKNLGIRESKGEYVAFLDDDDVYRQDALKVLLKYIKHSNADIVYGDYLIEVEGKKKPGWSVDFNTQLLQKMNYIAMPVVMVKKSCLLEVGGFDETIKKLKDWNLWIRLQKRGYRFLHIPIIITEVSQQKDSISNKFKVDYDEQGHYLPTYFSPSDCEIYATETILGKKEPLRVAIFTLTKDRLKYTQQMFEAMSKNAGYPFKWFVVDQGSKDGTQEWLKGKTDYYLLNKENVGIAKGWNQAVELIKEKIKPDILLKIDNDCQMMSQNWLKDMIDIFNRNRTLILSPYVEGLEDSPGGVLRQRMSGDSPYVLINDKMLGLVPFLGGICWASPVEVYDEFKFDEEHFIKGNKDYLISQYAKSIGYNLFYMEELRCWHIRGTLGQKEDYPEYFKEAERLEKQKYGKNR